jgi:hypothetical protein
MSVSLMETTTQLPLQLTSQQSQRWSSTRSSSNIIDVLIKSVHIIHVATAGRQAGQVIIIYIVINSFINYILV